MAAAAVFVGVLVFGACTQERPACAPEALAAIEVAYINEATVACEGQTFDACTALPAIREKYRGKRAEWEACK
jgi:hypothetical protein